ncbi:MAG: response regulator [Christensenellales bacterium]|nr:response regulator [Christensenellales bacterium]
MIIIIVDDEVHALEELEDTVLGAVAEAEVHLFRKAEDALAFAQTARIDVAFLDIEMRGMNGLQLAKALKDIYGQTNIIFVTSYSEYAVQAFALHPSGYLLKPVGEKELLRELENLRFPIEVQEEKRLRLHCFGNFDAYVGNEQIHFGRSKTKEILAYLTDRQGSSCTMGELIAVLWENKPVNASMRSNLRGLIYDLKHTLQNAGVSDAICKKRNELALVTKKVECDYYEFLKGNPAAVNLYRGEYMAQYSWAEMTTGALMDLV